MSLLATDAIVLHAFDYLESSRILRLATREGGVRSVLARGARSSRRRFGSALDLFAQGTAQIHQKPGRDLDTLGGFDVARARPELAGDLARFTGASAVAELTLHFSRANADPGLFEAVARGLDGIAAARPGEARGATLAAAWRIVAELGFAPSLDACSECHTLLDPALPVLFSHPAGGALCERCGRLAPAGRTLPPAARAAVRAWTAGHGDADSSGMAADAGAPAAPLSESDGRAHQRLLREFLHEHLLDTRPLRAFDVWEHQGWGTA